MSGIVWRNWSGGEMEWIGKVRGEWMGGILVPRCPSGRPRRARRKAETILAEGRGEPGGRPRPGCPSTEPGCPSAEPGCPSVEPGHSGIGEGVSGFGNWIGRDVRILWSYGCGIREGDERILGDSGKRDVRILVPRCPSQSQGTPSPEPGRPSAGPGNLA